MTLEISYSDNFTKNSKLENYQSDIKGAWIKAKIPLPVAASNYNVSLNLLQQIEINLCTARLLALKVTRYNNLILTK